jgi:hypothetical protein
LFFVPNLLIAEFFVRNMHRRLVLPGRLRWPAVTVLAGVALVFVYTIGVASATRTGKFGEHLLRLLGNKDLNPLSPAQRNCTAWLCGCDCLMREEAGLRLTFVNAHVR